MAKITVATKSASGTRGTSGAKKVCFFCENKSVPTYTDAITLKKFMTDRGKIVPKLRSGVCSKHQRRVAREVKRARHLALLPFTLSV